MPLIPVLSDLYSEAENQQLGVLQTAYNSALAQLTAETQRNADAKGGHSTIPGPNPGSVKWVNPVVNNGMPTAPDAYMNWIAASDQLLTSLQALAIQKKVELDDYRADLDNKYTTAFQNAHPDLAAQQIDANAQVAQTQAMADAQAQGLIAQANATASKTAAEIAAETASKAQMNKIILWSVVGVLGLAALGAIVYFVTRPKTAAA